MTRKRVYGQVKKKKGVGNWSSKPSTVDLVEQTGSPIPAQALAKGAPAVPPTGENDIPTSSEKESKHGMEMLSTLGLATSASLARSPCEGAAPSMTVDRSVKDALDTKTGLQAPDVTNALPPGPLKTALSIDVSFKKEDEVKERGPVVEAEPDPFATPPPVVLVEPVPEVPDIDGDLGTLATPTRPGSSYLVTQRRKMSHHIQNTLQSFGIQRSSGVLSDCSSGSEGDFDDVIDLPGVFTIVDRSEEDGTVLSFNRDGPITEEEVLWLRLRKLKRLVGQYRDQFQLLRSELKRAHSAFVARECDRSMGKKDRFEMDGGAQDMDVLAAYPVRRKPDCSSYIFPVDAFLANQTEVLQGAKPGELVFDEKAFTPGIERNHAALTSLPRCSFVGPGGVKCSAHQLPFTEFCFAHVFRDPKQLLFKKCANESCDFSVLRSQEFCVLHDDSIKKKKEAPLDMTVTRPPILPSPLVARASVSPQIGPDGQKSAVLKRKRVGDGANKPGKTVRVD